MRALKWIGGAVLILFVAVALFFTFGLNTLRAPITKAVTKATGRELLIEGDLRPVWSWVHPRIRAERVSFANADWGKADYLLKAEVIDATISVLPLLVGRVVLPEVHLTRAEMSLEQDANGKKNWILKDDPDEKQQSRIFVKLLTVDEGRLAWEDATRDTSLKWQLSSEGSGIAFTAEGKYKGLPLKTAGHAGHVLGLRDKSTPFPLKGDLTIGATSAKMEGTITGLIGLKGIDLKFQHLSGKSMEELYRIIGIAFPDTRPYKLSGRLARDGKHWRFDIVSGKVGESDLAGTLQVETGDYKGQKRPFMQGDLTSKVLNLGDLGVLVGTKQPRKSGVLPDAPFDSKRWQSVDTDVRIRAGTIRRPEQLPLENFSTRIQMRDKVLTLNPLDFGIAGGKLTGTIRLDGTKEPIRGDVKMRVQKLQLAKLFPTIEQAQGSSGELSGIIELAGSGDSVGKLLGSANGKIGVFMDGGQVSEFLMELAALNLWGATRVKLKGDKQIDIRCAIADFGVKNGVMEANALVFDTTVVNIGGGGTINLKSEEMDLKLQPRPKERSIASLRSPLLVRGTFSEPDVGPDMGKLTAKAAGSIALGIVNPLLAILPLMQDGSGKDSNCVGLIAQATSLSKPKAASSSPKPPAAPSKEQATSSSRSSASGATAQHPPSPPER